MLRVFGLGDLHGDWEFLNRLDGQADVILACGDFGYWPGGKYLRADGSVFFAPEYFRLRWTKVYFCDGNHEHIWALMDLVDKHGRRPIEVAPNVFYCPRGTVVKISGKNVLFFGGALSIDREVRTFGETWFPEEVPDGRDLQAAMEAIETVQARGEEIHTVVSHQAPSAFRFTAKGGAWPFRGPGLDDPTRAMLDEILEKARPRLWLFGHWHICRSGYHEKTGTRWRGLCSTPRKGCFEDFTGWFVERP